MYETNFNKFSVTYPDNVYTHGVVGPADSNAGHVQFYTIESSSTGALLPNKMLAHVEMPADNPTSYADYCLVAKPGGGTTNSFVGGAFQNVWGAVGVPNGFSATFAHDGTPPAGGTYSIGFPMFDMRLAGGSYTGQPVWVSASFSANGSSDNITASALPVKLALNGKEWDFLPPGCTTDCTTLGSEPVI